MTSVSPLYTPTNNPQIVECYKSCFRLICDAVYICRQAQVLRRRVESGGNTHTRNVSTYTHGVISQKKTISTTIDMNLR